MEAFVPPVLDAQGTSVQAAAKATLFHLQRPAALPGADAASFHHGNCETITSLNIERVRKQDLIKEMRKRPGSPFTGSAHDLSSPPGKGGSLA